MKRAIRYLVMTFMIFCLSFLILKPTNEESKIKSRITYKSYKTQDEGKDNNILEVIDNTDGRVKDMPVPSPNKSLGARTLPIPNPNEEIVISELKFTDN